MNTLSLIINVLLLVVAVVFARYSLIINEYNHKKYIYIDKIFCVLRVQVSRVISIFLLLFSQHVK